MLIRHQVACSTLYSVYLAVDEKPFGYMAHRAWFNSGFGALYFGLKGKSGIKETAFKKIYKKATSGDINDRRRHQVWLYGPSSDSLGDIDDCGCSYSSCATRRALGTVLPEEEERFKKIEDVLAVYLCLHTNLKYCSKYATCTL